MEIEKKPASSMLTPLFGITLATTMVLAIGAYALHSLATPREIGDCYEQENAPSEQAPHDYSKWQKPLLALVLSGQMHGYNDPCGCSDPQFGGLTRRYNFIDSLKKKDWKVVGIDLGELPQLKGIPEQNVLKYGLSVKALSAMGYRAVGIGRDEILLPLGPALAPIFDVKRPYPRLVSLSLDKTAKGETYYDLNVRRYEIIGDMKPKIGVISMMGADLREDLKGVENFLANQQELPKALKAFADAGVEFAVILHHEYPKIDPKIPEGFQRQQAIEKARKELALKCAQYCADERKKNPKIPPIQLMMILTEEPEPPMLLSRLDPNLPTQVMEIGHKGRWVGLIGIYADKKSLRIQHQNIAMGPEWKTSPGLEKNNPVTALMEIYNNDLKREDMLAKFPRDRHYNQIPLANQKGLKATYVGSERCSDCHDHAWKVWSTPPPKEGPYHFKATKTLEDEKYPSGRQYDPECMMCHTTGFKNPGGYGDLVANLQLWPAKPAKAPDAKKVKDHNDALRGVGCESCHGPGSEHVKNPDDATLYKLINPYGPTAQERKLEDKLTAKTLLPKEKQLYDQLFRTRTARMAANLCLKCHDEQNDVNWGKDGRDTADKWLKLIHRSPRNNAPPANQAAPAIGINEPPPVIEVIPDQKK